MNLGPNQQAWVEALESGDYSQTKEYLCYNSTYCCLGVACVINGETDFHDPLDGELYSDLTTFPGIQENLALFTSRGDVDDNAAPDVARDALKYVRDELGRVGVAHADDLMLVDLNDIYHLSFEEIATMLRLYPELYFSEPR